MRLNIITSVFASLFAVSTMAAQVNDVIQHRLNEVNIDELRAAGAENDDHTVEIVLFYQPSYAVAFGEYNMLRRMWSWVDVANQSYAAHGIDYKIVVKDIQKISSVSDDLPFLDVYDSEGNIIQDGAGYFASLAILNPGNPEYDLVQKWGADLVSYTREWREGDKLNGSKLRGLASVGGSFSEILDDGTDPTLDSTFAHEVGHNIGLNHEEGVAVVGVEYARAYSCGDNTTIMNSVSSNTVNHYSDPSITFNGQPCGVEDAADNARVLRENLPAVTQRGAGVESLGTVSFAQQNYVVSEQDDLLVTLTRDGDLTDEATVKVFTENGTATWGNDFTQTFALATFLPGESTATATLAIVNDVIDDDNESFGLVLKYGYKLDVDVNNTASVTITEGTASGFAGQFAISGVDSIEEGQSGMFTITRSGGAGDVIINVKSESGTATSASDYVALNEQLLFTDGEVSKTVMLVVADDQIGEPTESLTISLTSPSETAEFSANAVSVSIIDNEPQVVGTFGVSANQSSVSEGETITFTISRTTGFSGAVNGLLLTTFSNGATAVESEFQFTDGQASVTVVVTVPENATAEGNYTASAEITISTDGAVINKAVTSLSVQDNDTPAASVSDSDSSSGGGSMHFLLVSLFMTALFRCKQQ